MSSPAAAAPAAATAPPVGDASLAGGALWALVLAGRLVTMDYDRLTTAHAGWSSNAGSVLGLLHQQGPVPAGALAARCGLRDSTVTGILDKLALQGLVHRGTDPDDRRRAVVELTAAGADQLESVFPVLERASAQIAGCLSAQEQDQLLLLLSKLVHARVPGAL